MEENNKVTEEVLQNIGMKKRIIIAAGIAAIICILAVVAILAVGNSPARKLEKQLALAQKYLTELDYEQAIVAFETAISIDPKNVDAYMGLAEVYIEMGDLAKAKEVLEEGYAQTEDAGIAEKLAEIEKELSGQDDGQSGETAGQEPDGDESEVPDGTEAEEKPEEQAEGTLRKLFADGDKGNLLKANEVTFLGHSIEKWDFDTVKSMLESAGYDVSEDTSDSGRRFGNAADISSNSVVGFAQNQEADVVNYINCFGAGEYNFINCRNIQLHDDMETVLKKLGFENASSIVEYYRKNPAPIDQKEREELLSTSTYVYGNDNGCIVGATWAYSESVSFMNGLYIYVSEGWTIDFFFKDEKLDVCDLTYHP